MKYLIGIDDTDNLESRGTGYRARMLGESLVDAGLGEVRAITRHQLLVHPDIPYTSHNSSACLLAESEAAREVLTGFCAEYLGRESAPGSDAGLCVLEAERAGPEVRTFGERAKRQVLQAMEAREVAGRAGAVLQGLTGDQGGVIGALAAVGLHAGGNDGRCLWLPGLRELAGPATVSSLQPTGIRLVQTVDGEQLAPDEIVELGDWVRPVMLGGKAVLFVDRSEGGWRVADRSVIKARSG